MAGIRKKRRACVERRDCVACGCCVKVCPMNAIQVYRGLYAQVDESKCVGCGKCAKECPATVIEIREEYLAARSDSAIPRPFSSNSSPGRAP